MTLAKMLIAPFPTLPGVISVSEPANSQCQAALRGTLGPCACTEACWSVP